MKHHKVRTYKSAEQLDRADQLAWKIAVVAADRVRIEDAVAEVMPRLEGDYSTVVMTKHAVVAFRDPHGVRPLALGKIKAANGYDECFVVASESCAFDIIGAELLREVAPGELVSLADLRPRLAGVARPDVDAALVTLSSAPGVRIIPESNQKTLTAAERAAAVSIGNQDRHLIAIGV